MVTYSYHWCVHLAACQSLQHLLSLAGSYIGAKSWPVKLNVTKGRGWVYWTFLSSFSNQKFLFCISKFKIVNFFLRIEAFVWTFHVDVFSTNDEWCHRTRGAARNCPHLCSLGSLSFSSRWLPLFAGFFCLASLVKIVDDNFWVSKIMSAGQNHLTAEEVCQSVCYSSHFRHRICDFSRCFISTIIVVVISDVVWARCYGKGEFSVVGIGSIWWTTDECIVGDRDTHQGPCSRTTTTQCAGVFTYTYTYTYTCMHTQSHIVSVAAKLLGYTVTL